MIPGLDFGGTQDRGRRPYQEDSFHLEPLPAADEPGGDLLMVMADGMGGHRGGAEASAAAVEAFVHTYLAEAEPETERLRRGLLAANQRIAEESAANPALRGMGCTLVGASLTPAGLHLISVGDSLAFLFRHGKLTRLNADHSMAPVLQEAVRLGRLSAEEMASHPHRNALRSAVTGQDLSLIDLPPDPFELLPGDRLIVASDGILTLPEERIVELLEAHPGQTADELSELLVQAVTEAGDPHQDNVTVLVAALPGPALLPQWTRPWMRARALQSDAARFRGCWRRCRGSCCGPGCWPGWARDFCWRRVGSVFTPAGTSGVKSPPPSRSDQGFAAAG